MKELADCVKGYVIPHEAWYTKTKERQKPSNIRVLRWVYTFNLSPSGFVQKHIKVNWV